MKITENQARSMKAFFDDFIIAKKAAKDWQTKQLKVINHNLEQ